MPDGKIVKAHDQAVTNRYTIHYPDHAPREDDPHYVDFHHWRKAAIEAGRKCQFALDRGGDESECAGGPEAHHGVIEFALMNGVDLSLFERTHPGISDKEKLGAWVESDANLVLYCAKHHRGHGGVHHASASDWVAEHYIRNMIS